MIKLPIYQEDMTVVNMYAPQYIKQKLIELKRDADNPTIIVGYLNTSLSIMGRITMQKISKDMEDLNNTINQLGPTDIYKIVYPTIAEYIVFLSSRGTFFRIDHMICHDISL